MNSLSERPQSGQIFQPSDSTQNIDLFVEIRDLLLQDVSNQNTKYCCVLYEKMRFNKNDNSFVWSEVDKTHPSGSIMTQFFGQQLQIQYSFEKNQELKFEIQDIQTCETLAYIETTLAKIMGSKYCILQQNLESKAIENQSGVIIIKAEQKLSNENKDWDLILKIAGRNLATTTTCLICANNQPFFEITKTNLFDKSVIQKVYHSDIADDTLNPVYSPFKITGQQLCNSDRNLPLIFDFYSRVGIDNVYLGSCSITVNEMIDRKEFTLKNRYTNSDAGVMSIYTFKLTEKPSFIEYLKSGWQIGMQIGIDFTDSNGDQTEEESLHILTQFNQYEQAISSICSRMQYYDEKQQFPVFGFGAVPTFMNQTTRSDCFPLNGQESQPEINGVHNILRIYRENLSQIKFSQYSSVAPILQKIIEKIKDQIEEQKYTLVLIMVASEIDDLKRVQELICQCAYLPVSIIIIGMSDEKLSCLKHLNTEKSIIRDSRGNPLTRECIQTLKFSKCLKVNGQDLFEQAIKEIPNQFIQYMVDKEIQPA
eukprot:403364469